MDSAGSRKMPQRTCIACRTTGDKRGLVRIVRLAAKDKPDQSPIEVDLSGKKPGRGAYLCRQYACWEEALKKGRLESALKAKLRPDDKLALSQFAVSIRDAIAV